MKNQFDIFDLFFILICGIALFSFNGLFFIPLIMLYIIFTSGKSIFAWAIKRWKVNVKIITDRLIKYAPKMIVAMAITTSLWSCHKIEKDDAFEVYTISKHKSTYDIEKIPSCRIDGVARFSSSCEYELTKNIGQINKLVGLSSGMNHHENSIRIGWEYDGAFKLYAYWYADGVRDQKYLTSVMTDEEFKFTVEITDAEFYVQVNRAEFRVQHGVEVGDAYMLYPYFGGEQPFPGSIHGDDECNIYMSCDF